jgi:hypothetical protein
MNDGIEWLNDQNSVQKSHNLNDLFLQVYRWKKG